MIDKFQHENLPNNYVSERQAPEYLLTMKVIKEQGLRLKRGAKAVARCLTVYTGGFRLPWAKFLPEIPTQELKEFAKYLDTHGFDQEALHRLPRFQKAGYACWKNLYHHDDTEDGHLPLATKAFNRACDELYRLFFDGTDEFEHIVKTASGKATWKQSRPSIQQHLLGEVICGHKRGQYTRFIEFDGDNHDASNDPWHRERVLTLARWLTKHFPQYRLVAEVNKDNGSTKLWLYLGGKVMNQTTTVKWWNRVAAMLEQKYPHLHYPEMEVYPVKPQFFLPLRPDKLTIIDNRCPRLDGVTYDPSCFLDYLRSDKKFDLDMLEMTLFAVMKNLPPKSEAEPEETVAQPQASKQIPEKNAPKKPQKLKTGMGRTPKYYRQTARIMTDFIHKGIFEQDTIGAYISPCLWYLWAKGVGRETAVNKMISVLDALPEKMNSNRLQDNPAELYRTDLRYTSRAIWSGTGYCAYRERSEKEWLTTVKTWDAKGFDPFDLATFSAPKKDESDLRIVWNTDLLDLVPALAEIIHTDIDTTKMFLDKVLCWVHMKSELSLSKVGVLLKQAGIKAFEDKNVAVRNFLKDNGLIFLQKRYANFGTIRHGNFYICSLAVQFSSPHNTQHNTQVSTSSSVFGYAHEPLEEADFVQFDLECRRLHCDECYRQRLIKLCGWGKRVA